MKKFRFSFFIGLLLLFSTSMYADDYTPATVEAAFKSMYPKVSNVEWEHKADCYVAEFIMDNQEIDVWFNKDAQWVMTETDVESLEKVPLPVAKAFMNSTMASMRLTDVRIITFPKDEPEVIVIEVEQYNSDEEFQLFYGPDGKLLESFNTTDFGGEIYPGLFN